MSERITVFVPRDSAACSVGADQVAAEIWMHVKKRLAPESAPLSVEELL